MGSGLFQRHYFAHMSTQRSELINSVFNGYVNSHSSIYLFVTKYIWQGRSKGFQVIASQAYVVVKPSNWKVCTNSVHKKVVWKIQIKNLRRILSYDVEDSGDGMHKFIDIRDTSKIYTANYEESCNTILCNCKLFKSSGMLCTHVLEVFRKLKFHANPTSLYSKEMDKRSQTRIDLCWRCLWSTRYNIVYQHEV